MKHIIIGTAGHIDHGKTCLTQALTGKNTDRLQEEQERGITIENGFAMLTLPDGQTASIIDVPGHERFVRNMIVGATGMDLALMVIAADDGFMPQTGEHLDILQLLQVKKGIIVITKCDMADEEWIDTVEEDIRDRVKGTFLEDAPLVRVSAKTGQGIEELKERIRGSLEETEPKKTDVPARLPVDRVFSVQGFGTVVTGTLTDGLIHPGDDLIIEPAGKKAKVRELQNHDVHIDEACAGMRVAVNLAGIEKEEVSRGDVLAAPGSVYVTDRLDVVLRITDDCQFFIKNASRLHLFHGTSECLCKLRLLDAEELSPGDTGYAQLLLEHPVAARNGDRFIVRFFSPVITVGGGRILNARAKRRKRNDQAVLDSFRAMDSEDMDIRAVQYVEERGPVISDPAVLSGLLNCSISRAEEISAGLVSEEKVIPCDKGFIGKKAYAGYRADAEKLLSDYHASYPLRPGMPVAEFRKQAGPAEQDAAAMLLGLMTADGLAAVDNGTIHISSFVPVLNEKQKETADAVEAYFAAAGMESRTYDAMAGEVKASGAGIEQIYDYLCSTGRLVALGQGETMSVTAYEKALEAMKRLASSGQGVTLGHLRDELGISRKYAQLYLEYWDRTGLTLRQGDVHILK